MASVEECLKAFIEANLAGVGKGYPLQVPQDAAYPAFAYQLIDSNPLLTHDRQVARYSDRVQITFLCASYGAAKRYATQLRSILDAYKGYMGGILVDFCKTSASDDFADTHQLPVAKLDVIIHYRV